MATQETKLISQRRILVRTAELPIRRSTKYFRKTWQLWYGTPVCRHRVILSRLGNWYHNCMSTAVRKMRDDQQAIKEPGEQADIVLVQELQHRVWNAIDFSDLGCCCQHAVGVVAKDSLSTDSSSGWSKMSTVTSRPKRMMSRLDRSLDMSAIFRHPVAIYNGM